MALRRLLCTAATCGAALCGLALVAAPGARAEFVVLRSGQRLHVTSYQLVDGKYRLQMNGGSAEIAADEVTAIEPEEVFTAEKSVPPEEAKPPYRELVEKSAARYGIDADLIASVIAVESNFDPKAISRKKARGLMQLMPETAARLGVHHVFDPRENIDGGARYLRDLLALYHNDLTLTLAAYNAGPDKVEQYGRVVPPFRETISYVRRVKRAYQQAKATARKTETPAQIPSAAASAGLPFSAISGGL